MKKLFIIAAIAISLAFTTDSFAQKLKPSPTPSVTNVPVTAAFSFCAAADAACASSNRVRMDADTPFSDGADGVTAIFNRGSGSNDLTINLITSFRSVWLDFSNPYKFYNNAGQYVVPSWYGTPQNVKPFFGVLKAYNAKLTCGDPIAGCNYRTAMNVGNWKIDGIEYLTQWNPDSTFRAVVNEQGPTSYVNVHYQNNGSGDVFTITPIPNTDSGLAISGMAKTVRKSTTNSGQYVMPFTLVVRPK